MLSSTSTTFVVFSDTEKEHVKRLAAVFEHFREHGLKLKPSKCEFFKEEINYLGPSCECQRDETGY